METENIIWAMSPRGKYLHAYPSIQSLESGIPICGVQCNPTQTMDPEDLPGSIAKQVMCPDCLARLAYAKYIRPITDLYKERSNEDIVE